MREAPPKTLPADEYERRRTQHRPTCAHCMQRAALDLAARGLLSRDIAAALGIAPAVVEQMLQEVPRAVQVHLESDTQGEGR